MNNEIFWKDINNNDSNINNYQKSFTNKDFSTKTRRNNNNHNELDSNKNSNKNNNNFFNIKNIIKKNNQKYTIANKQINKDIIKFEEKFKALQNNSNNIKNYFIVDDDVKKLIPNNISDIIYHPKFNNYIENSKENIHNINNLDMNNEVINLEKEDLNHIHNDMINNNPNESLIKRITGYRKLHPKDENKEIYNIYKRNNSNGQKKYIDLDDNNENKFANIYIKNNIGIIKDKKLKIYDMKKFFHHPKIKNLEGKNNKIFDTESKYRTKSDLNSEIKINHLKSDFLENNNNFTFNNVNKEKKYLFIHNNRINNSLTNKRFYNDYNKVSKKIVKNNNKKFKNLNKTEIKSEDSLDNLSDIADELLETFITIERRKKNNNILNNKKGSSYINISNSQDKNLSRYNKKNKVYNVNYIQEKNPFPNIKDNKYFSKEHSNIKNKNNHLHRNKKNIMNLERNNTDKNPFRINNLDNNNVNKKIKINNNININSYKNNNKDNNANNNKEIIQNINNIKIKDSFIIINKNEGKSSENSIHNNKKKEISVNNIESNDKKKDQPLTDLRVSIQSNPFINNSLNHKISKDSSLLTNSIPSEFSDEDEYMNKFIKILSNAGQDSIIKQIMKKKEVKKENKNKKIRHIKIDLDKNIIYQYKDGTSLTENYELYNKNNERINSKKNFDINIYMKKLKDKVELKPCIKKFNKNEIKIKENYINVENLSEKEIIPDLYEEEEEDIKSLERSLESSIDKLFDKNSFKDKLYNKNKNNIIDYYNIGMNILNQLQEILIEEVNEENVENEKL